MLSGAALTVLAFAPALAARAQTAPAGNTIGDVVVTATKTGTTNLQKTPLSVDVVSGADLKKEGIETFRDLQASLPSVKFFVQGTNPRIYIRGVGGYNSNDGDVSLYVDGVFLAKPTAVTQGSFNDIDRVEVLEGPQGTLFGRNSTGGAINFISKAPSDHFTFHNDLSVGNFALIDESASVSGPIADNVQASLGFSKFQHNGYLHNVDPGVGDGDAANRMGLRGQVKWEVTPDITNTVRADYIYTNETWQTGQNIIANVRSGKAPGITAGCSTVYVPGTAACGYNYDPLLESLVGNLRNIDYNILPHNNEIAYGVNDEFNWKINDHLSLKSLSAGRTDYSTQTQGNPGEINFSLPGPQVFEEYQLSQEFDLIHEFGPISGVVGVFYYLDHSYYTAEGISQGGNPVIPLVTNGYITGQNTFDPTTSRAIFAEESYHITPTLKVTVGARYTAESKNLNTYNYSENYEPGYPGNLQYNAAVPPSPPDFVADLNYNAHALTPKFAVDWQATPDALLYASVTNGYKSGGFNEGGRWGAGNGVAPTVPPPLGTFYGPENMWAYEGGLRSDWFDHTLRVNLSIFRYMWYGLQFNASIAPQTISTSNAGGAVTNGLEAAITYKPAPGLTIDLHTTLLDAKYVSFTQYGYPSNLGPFLNPNSIITTAGGKVFNASGNTLAEAPKVSLSLDAQKDFDLSDGADLYVRGEFNYQSLVYFDPTNVAVDSQPAYTVVNASIGYSPAHSHWTVSIWGKNLADTAYLVGAQTGGTILGGAVGDPRTFGVRLQYTY
jgi:iron complex outermembrane receptor protein